MNKIEEGKPKPLREVCPAANKKLEKLIMRCLHRSPKKRPGSVAEFAKELGKVS